MMKPTGYLLTGTSQSTLGGVLAALRHPRRSLRAMRGASLRRFAQQLAHRNDLTLLVAVQQETSRGRLTVESSDPGVPPRLDYHYLSTESDLARMREGVRTAVALLETQAFSHVARRITEPVPSTLASDALLDTWMRGHLGTAIHLCGSARMGPAADTGAVVDQYGRVHRVAGLRVADTSILPTAPSRGPFATAVLIGELVSDFVRRGD